MSKTIEEWKAASGYDDLLAAHSAALTERDALRAEVERLRLDVGRLLVAYGSRDEFDGVDEAIEDAAEMRAENNRLHVALGRILRAAQSLHRAWERERDLVERYQRDHDDWMWTTDKCDCAICDEVRDRKSLRSDARDGIVTRLRAFVRQLRADGLDIDDPDTAPTWTGKIYANGRLVFDLATARASDPVTAELHSATGIPYSARCHHLTRTTCAGCPDDAVCGASGRAPRKQSEPPLCAWCGKPVETGKTIRVTRTDAAETHTFHGSCWSAHAKWTDGLVKERP